MISVEEAVTAVVRYVIYPLCVTAIDSIRVRSLSKAPHDVLQSHCKLDIVYSVSAQR